MSNYEIQKMVPKSLSFKENVMNKKIVIEKIECVRDMYRLNMINTATQEDTSSLIRKDALLALITVAEKENIEMAAEKKKKLKEIFDTLVSYIGDTDPHIDDDWSDDEIRDEHPIFWAAKELNYFI